MAREEPLQIADSEGCAARRVLFFTILGTGWGLLLGLNAFAQASGPTTIASIGTGGAITGRVRGPGGVAIPGATVELIETQTGERKQTWSDESGNYTLTGVNPGTYKLQVSLVGFRTDVRHPVPVVAGKALQVSVALVMALPEDAAAGQENKIVIFLLLFDGSKDTSFRSATELFFSSLLRFSCNHLHPSESLSVQED